MKRRGWFVCALASGLVTLGVTGGSGADLMLGVSPTDGTTMLVKQFSVSAGVTIQGVEFRSNDPRTVFPEVFLSRDVGAAMSEGTIVARATDVGETSPGWVRALWSQPVRISEPGTYYAAVRMPSGQRKEGPAIGPGIGATEVPSASGSFVAGGTDGWLNAIRADLSLALVTSTVGKADSEPDAVPRTFLSGVSPAQAVATVRFGVEQRTHVLLEIYNVAGQRVHRLYAGPAEAGVYSREWDGRDEHGHDIAAGMYLIRLTAAGKVLTQKLVIAK